MSDRVFIDTSAYFAASNAGDVHHARAATTFRRLIQEGAETYTTNFVVAETHTLIVNRGNRDAAARVLSQIYASETRIIRATEADER